MVEENTISNKMNSRKESGEMAFTKSNSKNNQSPQLQKFNLLSSENIDKIRYYHIVLISLRNF